jgi:hypothetical protein
VREADNITAICELTAYTMSDLQHLITLQTSTARYANSFTFLYVDDVRTSQKTGVLTSRACYGNNFIFYT